MVRNLVVLVLRMENGNIASPADGENDGMVSSCWPMEKVGASDGESIGALVGSTVIRIGAAVTRTEGIVEVIAAVGLGVGEREVGFDVT